MEQKIRIDQFLNADGNVVKIPRKEVVRRAVLAYVSQRFQPGVLYTESQINIICDTAQTFGDVFLLRRELIDYKFLHRTPDGSQYWREMPENADEDAPGTAGTVADCTSCGAFRKSANE
mgnify:CR=1 FL=1